MSPDYVLKMEMTSLVYVHTQRYVSELQAFFRLFPHLRKRIGYSKGNEIVSWCFEYFLFNVFKLYIAFILEKCNMIIFIPFKGQFGNS